MSISEDKMEDFYREYDAPRRPVVCRDRMCGGCERCVPGIDSLDEEESEICPACEEDEVVDGCFGLCENCYHEFESEYNEHISSTERETLRLKNTGEIYA